MNIDETRRRMMATATADPMAGAAPEMSMTPMQQPQTEMETQPEAPVQELQPQQVIGKEQLRRFLQILQKYKTGKAHTEQRIVAGENWWKLRNTMEARKVSTIGMDGSFTAQTGWMHNVIVSKHADAMEAYPEPNILPREAQDQQEAQSLSRIVPCVLEHNDFESTYSDVMWAKVKFGTGAYKVIWDPGAHNGLGDIAVSAVNLLNLYWEPGVTDIQKSRFMFQTELRDKEELEEEYPHLKGQLKSNGFVSTKFLYDDTVDTSNKITVIEVYYHRRVNGRQTLQYVKFVGDEVLEATENRGGKGLYDHGLYPFVFDVLYPIEGSPCGYGYVDVCRNPQIVIDILNTAFIKNAAVGAVPRYMANQDAGINIDAFLDMNNPIIPVGGDVSETGLRKVDHNYLDSAYLTFLDKKIQELREISGNTEASTGNIQSGVTAASAIAALQEASGKGSRDSNLGSYRSYVRLTWICIELIRQFYDLPRTFRITGQNGAPEFVSYSNAGIKPQHQGMAFGMDMGYRRPVFDIKVSSQKKNVYTKVAQNELALQFFQLGFFNPQMADQALITLEIMDFDGKDTVMQKIARNGTLMQKLQKYMQMALQMATVMNPQMAQMIMQDMAMTFGPAAGGMAPGMAGMGGQGVQMPESDNIAGIQPKEHAIVQKAREKSNASTQPEGGEAVRGDKK